MGPIESMRDFEVKTKWDRSAMRFASVAYLARQAMVAVTFENGDRFVVGVHALLAKSNGAVIDWKKMRVGETGDVLEAPARGYIVEIPWDRIRAVADPDYQRHLADVAKQRAVQLGKRIRSMRLESKVTRAQLADKLGETTDFVAKLESGKSDSSLDMLNRLARALNKPIRDFST
jgi:DNA-binding XRE family transcriptional regulator